MKVILLQELKGRGGEGDVIEVANGFANNYLFPQKIAILATKGNLKQLEMRKKNIAVREAARLDDAEKVRAVLEDVVVRIPAKVGEEGQLFGSVTALMVADALNAAVGFDVDKKRIDLKAAIKTAGEHEAILSLYRDIKSPIKIFVYDENKSLEEVEAGEAAPATETTASTPEAAAEVVEAVEAATEEVAEVAEEAKEEATTEVAEAATEAVAEATESASDEK